MPTRRTLTVSIAVAGLLVTGFASIATAHPGHDRRHVHPLREFDNIRIDHRGLDAFTAFPGDRDLVFGLGGDDVISTGDMHDHVLGHPGNDTIDAGEGRDWVWGDFGADTITPGPGLDVVHAGWGADTVFAADGEKDWVSCGPGRDSYTADPQDRIARDCENDITP
jgi:Ca2+-binding RTX toxin-like protein